MAGYTKTREERLASAKGELDGVVENDELQVSQHAEAVTEDQGDSQSEPASPAPTPAPSMTSAQMKARISELEGLVHDAKAESVEREGMVNKFGVWIKEGTVIHDPYSSQNPIDIKQHPPGFRFGWLNPDFRDAKGWKGWKPVSYDDQFGQNLDLYMADPPAKFEFSARTDNYVRRGRTSVLCVLPIELWLFRQMETEDLSRKRNEAIEGAGTSALRPDGSILITGDGPAKQERPQGGFRFRHEGRAGDFLTSSAKVGLEVAKESGDASDLVEARRQATGAKRALHN